MPRSAGGGSAGTASTASSASPPPAAPPAPTSAAALRAELDRRKIPTRLPRDVLAFLLRYPSQASSSSFSTSTGAGVQGEAPSANLRFYQDRQAALPRRAKCSELQDELRGNWDELEYRHNFVQWFFPIREQGVNGHAQPLELHEIEAIKSDPDAMARLIESYRIMLDFYGLRLVDPETGELDLEDPVGPDANSSATAGSSSSPASRFRHLERHPHNFLRITRILKCLGEFGLDQYPPSFLLFLLLLQPQPSSGSRGPAPLLSDPSLLRSYDTYWRWCVRNDADREMVVRTSERVRNGKGEWTWEQYREWVRGRRS
ncbi:hypothetical protein JCM8202_001399 [Rhodotorula sphaerocarpa]